MKIGVVVSDAGAAQHLSLLTKGVNEKFMFHVVGTAKKIFERNSNFVKLTPIDEIIANSSHLYVGRSWESDIGLYAIEQAIKQKIKTTLFLDHWGFRAHEFTKNGKFLMPSNVIVFDRFALDEAQVLFPESNVSLEENLFLSQIKNRIEALKMNKRKYRNNLLYLSEPIDRHSDQISKNNSASDPSFKFSEMQAFDYLISNLHLISPNIDSIVIRPHPADNLADLIELFSEKDSRIRFSNSEDLVADICESDYVVGSQTFGLVISVMAGKKTYSIIPPDCGDLVIPYDEIIMLRDL
jgi:hypothetical protein